MLCTAACIRSASEFVSLRPSSSSRSGGLSGGFLSSSVSDEKDDYGYSHEFGSNTTDTGKRIRRRWDAESRGKGEGQFRGAEHREGGAGRRNGRLGQCRKAFRQQDGEVGTAEGAAR